EASWLFTTPATAWTGTRDSSVSWARADAAREAHTLRTSTSALLIAVSFTNSLPYEEVVSFALRGRIASVSPFRLFVAPGRERKRLAGASFVRTARTPRTTCSVYNDRSHPRAETAKDAGPARSCGPVRASSCSVFDRLCPLRPFRCPALRCAGWRRPSLPRST